LDVETPFSTAMMPMIDQIKEDIPCKKLSQFNFIMQIADHNMRTKPYSRANKNMRHPCWWDSDCDQAKRVKYDVLKANRKTLSETLLADYLVKKEV